MGTVPQIAQAPATSTAGIRLRQASSAERIFLPAIPRVDKIRKQRAATTVPHPVHTVVPQLVVIFQDETGAASRIILSGKNCMSLQNLHYAVVPSLPWDAGGHVTVFGCGEAPKPSFASRADSLAAAHAQRHEVNRRPCGEHLPAQELRPGIRPRQGTHSKWKPSCKPFSLFANFYGLRRPE
jgi:hypothetical protein